MDNIQNNNDFLNAQQGQLQQPITQNPVPEVILLDQYQPKPLFDIKKGDTAFAVCALCVCIFTAVSGIFGGFALGYLISVVLMTLMFGIYFAKSGKADVLSVICGLLGLANSAVFVCTTNGSVRFFGVVVSFLLGLVCFDGFTNGAQKGNRQTLGVLYSAASTMGNIGVSLKSLFSNSNGEKKTIGKVIIGLLCAIPVLAVIIPLLISSDDAFRGMMSDIFGNAFANFFKAIFGAIISMFVISYGFSLKAGRVARVKEGKFAGLESVFIISFLSAIAACYLLYLFSQLAYFFSAFKGFLPDGDITYSSYARKGFFEMCVIAVINLCLVFLSLILAKKKNGKVCHGIKAIATFIAAFTLIIIATAISKMVLYINAYGMTVLRISTSAFMIFLAVTFIAVILRIYINKINIVKTALITAGCIVLILGTVNVNAVCAKYNYQAYKSGTLKTIDVKALYELGDEGIPYIVRIACSKDKDAAQDALGCLAEAYLYDYFDDMQYALDFTTEDLKQNQKGKGFEHFSIPKSYAYDELYKFIESNPDFASTCYTYFDEATSDFYW